MAYYSEKLSGKRLRECYDIAPARVKQYLDAEIHHVLSMTKPEDSVLELGCGYGRVTWEIAVVAKRVVGIDTAAESIVLARTREKNGMSCEFLEMDATTLSFDDNGFDLGVCIQNGICAFGVDQFVLVKEAIRVARPGGHVLFSSYSGKFWPHRLEWFELQAERGLLGEIDYDTTGDGVIVCKDGFRAGAMGDAEFRELCKRIELEPTINEVDESSIFYELVKPYDAFK
jgi:2-polyprenyl-6-hydroxyphenyl methylase/3-demethylubiquinone-9 3-methyltransferase